MGINGLCEIAAMNVPPTRKDAPARSRPGRQDELLRQLAERARRQRLRHQLERIHDTSPGGDADPDGEADDADVCGQPPGIGKRAASGWRTSALSAFSGGPPPVPPPARISYKSFGSHSSTLSGRSTRLVGLRHTSDPEWPALTVPPSLPTVRASQQRANAVAGKRRRDTASMGGSISASER